MCAKKKSGKKGKDRGGSKSPGPVQVELSADAQDLVKRVRVAVSTSTEADARDLDVFLALPATMQNVVLQELATIHERAPAQLLKAVHGRTGNKKLKKEIRKALYRMRQKGIEEAEIDEEEAGAPVWTPPKPPEAEAFVSGIDPRGERLLILIRPRPPAGYLVFEALTSDKTGLIQFHAWESSAKGVREIKARQIEMEDGPDFVDIDAEYCACLVEEAFRLGSGGSEPERSYLQARPMVSPPEGEPTKALIYEVLDPECPQDPQILDDSFDKLFAIEEIGAWAFIAPSMEQYFKEAGEANESRIIVNEYQKAERLEEICRRAATDCFDDRARLRFKRRLEETAWIFWKKERTEDAELALSAALSLEGGEDDSGPPEFAVALIRKTFATLLAAAGEEEKEKSDFIITP